jgi:hypothetical protein
VKGSSDDEGVAAHGNAVAEGITACSVVGNELGFLIPCGAVAACEYLNGSRPNPTIAKGLAHDDGITEKRHGIAKLIIGRPVASGDPKVYAGVAD